MIKSTHRKETVINAPIEIVSDLLTHVEKLGKCMQLIRSVEIFSDIKVGTGVKSRWTLVVGDDEPMIWEEEFTDFDPPNKFGFKTISGTHQMIGLTELTKISENQTRAVFSTKLLYDHPDMDKHEMTMANQLESMKKCLEK